MYTNMNQSRWHSTWCLMYGWSVSSHAGDAWKNVRTSGQWGCGAQVRSDGHERLLTQGTLERTHLVLAMHTDSQPWLHRAINKKAPWYGHGVAYGNKCVALLVRHLMQPIHVAVACLAVQCLPLLPLAAAAWADHTHSNGRRLRPLLPRLHCLAVVQPAAAVAGTHSDLLHLHTRIAHKEVELCIYATGSIPSPMPTVG